MDNPWKALNLDSWLQNMCRKINYKKPTQIQENVIKPIMDGHNVLSK